MTKIKLEGSDIWSSEVKSNKEAFEVAEAERKQMIEKVTDYISANIIKLVPFWEDEDGRTAATWLDVAKALENAETKECKRFLAGKDMYIMVDNMYLVITRK